MTTKYLSWRLLLSLLYKYIQSCCHSYGRHCIYYANCLGILSFLMISQNLKVDCNISSFNGYIELNPHWISLIINMCNQMLWLMKTTIAFIVCQFTRQVNKLYLIRLFLSIISSYTHTLIAQQWPCSVEGRGGWFCLILLHGRILLAAQPTKLR